MLEWGPTGVKVSKGASGGAVTELDTLETTSESASPLTRTDRTRLRRYPDRANDESPDIYAGRSRSSHGTTGDSLRAHMNPETGISGTTVKDIAASIEQSIIRGTLVPGAELPPVRDLAARLSVSPATAAGAYRSLRERGLVLTQGRRGTRVSERPPVSPRPPAIVPADVVDLASGNPDPELLPSLTDAVRRLELPVRLYGEQSSLPELVDALREDVVDPGPDPKYGLVVAGGLDAIERILQVHLRPGDIVAVEDPCYLGLLDLVRAMGLICRPMATDASGPLPDSLDQALRSGASAVVITPRAQNPTGAAIDEQRAIELRAILDQHPEILVIESDHVGRISAVPRFTTIRDRERWALVRSLNKSLGPDLRIGVVFGDARTISRAEGRLTVGPSWVSHITQRLALQLWRDPDVAALVSRAADVYRERREALLVALAEREISAIGRTGFNVWIPVDDETSVVQGLLAAGWGVRAGQPFRLESPPGIRVTTSRLTAPDTEQFADDLDRVLRPSYATRLA
jgi:DNA-binding transcriptional MocR family regulator